jgi:hypothetical protein
MSDPSFLALINQFLDQYKSLLTLLGLGTTLFGLAWFFRSSKAELFGKLDKVSDKLAQMADNHLCHIQSATERTADTLGKMQIEAAAHDMRAANIKQELEDFRAEVRSRPSECPLILKKD